MANIISDFSIFFNQLSHNVLLITGFAAANFPVTLL